MPTFAPHYIIIYNAGTFIIRDWSQYNIIYDSIECPYLEPVSLMALLVPACQCIGSHAHPCPALINLLGDIITCDRNHSPLSVPYPAVLIKPRAIGKQQYVSIVQTYMYIYV